MDIKLFLNDYYKLIKLLHDNEVSVLDEVFVPLTQQQIADTMNYSKMKVNGMFIELQKRGLVEQKSRGKYVLSDSAENIIDVIENVGLE